MTSSKPALTSSKPAYKKQPSSLICLSSSLFMVKRIQSETSGNWSGSYVTLGGTNNFVPVFFSKPIGLSFPRMKTEMSAPQLAYLFNISSNYLLEEFVTPLLILIDR